MCGVGSAVEDTNRRMLRARDAMDRRFAEPLDVPSPARISCVSEAHVIRTFRAVFGETPHRYLQRRRGGPLPPACFAMAWLRPSSFGEVGARRP
jgi:AraC-like DNA-binding protein